MLSESSVSGAQSIPTIPVPSKGYVKKLHYLCIVTLIPALPLIIPHCAIQGRFFPALGLIPHGLSAILAAYRLKIFQNKDTYEYQIVLNNDGDNGSNDGKKFVLKEKFVFALLDVLLGLWLLTFIVLSFVTYQYRNGKYLVAYAVEPMMVNTVIHTYLFLLALPNPWKKPKITMAICPHCQGSLAGGQHSPSPPASTASTPACSERGESSEEGGRPSIECVV
ncbi:hypothetical protein EJ08DRAFT_391816 [Tothia fuscella]|uniref:Uncharacterized protein n=1 Tax=Tothia fuscella TaxID=1048955 RepID=A0A9P4U3L8_9PEZI|nr:hypothetical protein EJ08DRAFT_391816 [Tothia fuscella]